MTRRFILNADGFGMSKAINRAVAEAYEVGFLKSVSLTPNGKEYDEAAEKILPESPELAVGIHLNITEGKSLCSDVEELTDKDSKFNNNIFKLIYKSYNPKEKEFLPQVEREFRRQIEKVLSKAKVYHIDSNGYIHLIPPLFDMVCRLAQEYQIPYVVTCFEKMYIIPEVYRILHKDYFINLLKKFCLNMFSVLNENTVRKYGLKTNDYVIGTSYAASMDALAVSYGIKDFKYENIIIETIIHPCRYEEGVIDNNFDQYMLSRNNKLADRILRLGYYITNYKEIWEADNKD